MKVPEFLVKRYEALTRCTDRVYFGSDSVCRLGGEIPDPNLVLAENVLELHY